MSDPYASQKKTKAETQRRILETLRDNPSTFNELHVRAGISATILAKHLKELRDNRLVTQRVEGRKVLYETTDKARKVEENARTAILIGLQRLKSLPQDKKNLSFLTDMMKLAKENPEYFEIIMDWLGKLTDFIISNEKVALLESQEARRSFQEAINAKLPKPSSQINNPKELREAFDKVLDVIKEVVLMETKGSRK